MDPRHQFLAARTRRHFLKEGGLGLGAMALGGLLGHAPRRARAEGPDENPLAARKPPHAPKAKSVIYLHMAGGPSQLDLFDPKPVLAQYDGKPCPEHLLEGKRFAFIQGVPTMFASPFGFQQHGESGCWTSELLPHFSRVVDDVAMIRSMSTQQFNHAPAQLLLHTGSPRLGGASMGSWVTYGLGSENQDLPAFVVLAVGGKTPSAGKSVWGSGFLPSVYQGVQCRDVGEPVLFSRNPAGVDRSSRELTIDAIRDLNAMQYRDFGSPETLTRIAQFELAFRMQTAVPEVMDISREPRHVLDLYGAQPGEVSHADKVKNPQVDIRADDPAFANNCLLARRLVESGVRFVQLYMWGWDHHGSNVGEDLYEALPLRCRQIDRALAGLITDLKQRGLLDDTLVVWGGEFGRTPMRENRNGKYGKYFGRDHHPGAFSLWMAGGGTKAGLNHGATDEIGYDITENEVTVRDLQATILHVLGLDPFALSYPFQGLDQRLIGPSDEGRIIHDLLA